MGTDKRAEIWGVDMAKKKEKELTYLQMPLPSGQGYGKMTKRTWYGFNKRQTIDTGALAVESNISTKEAPYLTPSEKWTEYTAYNPETAPSDVDLSCYAEHRTCKPIGLFGFQDFLLLVGQLPTAIHYDTQNIKEHVFYIYDKGADKREFKTHLHHSKGSVARSVVQFNVYDSTQQTYTKKLVIFPDFESIWYEISDIAPSNVDPSLNPGFIDDGPKIDYATVHCGRVFGVGSYNGNVYASRFNSYAVWDVDTQGSYSPNHGWFSPTQANTKTDGTFKGITTFQNHVICFKKDFMHEIYGTKNPFRVQDIYAEGTIDNRTIQDVDGQLIFVAKDNVKVYTGGNPRDIGYNLDMDKFTSAVSGTDGRNYYLYCSDGHKRRLFTYDTFTQSWSEQTPTYNIVDFAHNNNGMYALCEGLYTAKSVTELTEGSDNWSIGDTFSLSTAGQLKVFPISSGDTQVLDLEIDDVVEWVKTEGVLPHWVKRNGTDHPCYIFKMDTGSYDHDWHFETDMTTNASVDIKHIKKIQFLADVAPSANIKVHFLYGDEDFDSMTADEKSARLVYDFTNSGSAEVQKTIRVKPRMTANYGFRVRVSGHGFVRIYQMEMLIESGGDLYVSR